MGQALVVRTDGQREGRRVGWPSDEALDWTVVVAPETRPCHKQLCRSFSGPRQLTCKGVEKNINPQPFHAGAV